MNQRVEIKNLNMRRGLETGDDITDLAKDIAAFGQRVPILINAKFEVLDGVRRIEAKKSLGESFVGAILVTTMEEFLDGLNTSREEGTYWRTPSPRRMWNLQQDSGPYIRKRVKESRARLRGKPQHSTMDEPLVPIRSLMAQACGWNSESYFSAATSLYNIATDPEDARYELANELVEEVDAGRMTIFSARARLDRDRNLREGTLTWGEQRAILVNLVNSLSGVVKATRNMGKLSNRIPRDELTGYLKDLRELRAELYQFVHRIEKEVNEK